MFEYEKNSKLENNIINATWHVFENNLMMRLDIVCGVKINDEEYKILDQNQNLIKSIGGKQLFQKIQTSKKKIQP